MTAIGGQTSRAATAKRSTQLLGRSALAYAPIGPKSNIAKLAISSKMIEM